MYRVIEVGEKLQKGDEYFNGSKKVNPTWEPIKSNWVGKLLVEDCWPHRRKISNWTDDVLDRAVTVHRNGSLNVDL